MTRDELQTLVLPDFELNQEQMVTVMFMLEMVNDDDDMFIAGFAHLKASNEAHKMLSTEALLANLLLSQGIPAGIRHGLATRLQAITVKLKLERQADYKVTI